jgi:DNA-binding transcriptional MocR family regulator
MNQLSDDTTITRRICEEIKDGIRQGRYGPGARLPSTRTLAAEWGVSRTTVTAAYGQLIAEGYLETRPGARATASLADFSGSLEHIIDLA